MWIGTNTDIHEQKAFAEELAKKVRERTFELEQSNHELEQFVYITSHDLQEPLRKIRMFTDLARTGLEGEASETLRYLEKVSGTAHRMSTLLKELLNFTQMSRQEQLVATDLNGVVAQALVDLELLISEKGAEVEAARLPTLEAVPVQMHQLFYNLISNALKFSRKGVPPRITITSKTARPEVLAPFPGLQQGRRYCEIVVADNGIGFDPAYAEQIFNMFHRLHHRSEFGGTGIGLALCRKVVANHYGAIYAQSGNGEGAAFHILLPSG